MYVVCTKPGANTVTCIAPLVVVSLASRNSSPSRKNQKVMTAAMIAHTGMPLVVIDPSATVQETSPRGLVPLGVNTQDWVTEMSPMATRRGSVGIWGAA